MISPAGKTLTPDEELVLSVLPRSSRDAIPKRVIVQITGLPERKVRKILRDLLLRHHYPIGTCNRAGRAGAYLINDFAELTDATLHLARHISSTLDRYHALVNLFD